MVRAWMKWKKRRRKKEAESLIASILIKKGKVECFVQVLLSSVVRVSAKEKNKSFDLYKESKFSISIRSHIKWKRVYLTEERMK